MKRFVLLVLSLILLITVLPIQSALANNNTPGSKILYFADGFYLEIAITEISTKASNEIIGTNSYTYKNASGSIQWTATLTAKFTYTGTSSVCTSTSTSYSITNTDWHLISKSSSKSENTATGDFSFGYTSLGSTTTVPVTLTLRCDRYGNLS